MSDRARSNARKKGEYPEFIILLEKLDGYIEQEEWEGVIDAAIHHGTNLFGQVQIMARLAYAWLQLSPAPGEPRWFEKIIVLGRFHGKTMDYNLSWELLPPHIPTWTDKKMKGLAEKAAAWLES